MQQVSHTLATKSSLNVKDFDPMIDSIQPYTSGPSHKNSRNMPHRTEDSNEIATMREKLDKILDKKKPSRAIHFSKNYFTQ